MNQPPPPAILTATPSGRPVSIGPVTWPMVAYAFVRELPYTMMVTAGAVVAVVFVIRVPGSTFEPLAAVIGPVVVSALGRSRPAEHEMGRMFGTGAGAVLLLLLKRLAGYGG